MIEIISPNEVRIDGQNYGAVIDTIANNPQMAADLQRALVAWHAGVLAAQAQAIKDAQDGAAKDIADKTVELEAAQVRAIADAVAQIEPKAQELTATATAELSAALSQKTAEVSQLREQLAQVTSTKDVLAARIAAK